MLVGPSLILFPTHTIFRVHACVLRTACVLPLYVYFVHGMPVVPGYVQQQSTGVSTRTADWLYCVQQQYLGVCYLWHMLLVYSYMIFVAACLLSRENPRRRRYLGCWAGHCCCRSDIYAPYGRTKCIICTRYPRGILKAHIIR